MLTLTKAVLTGVPGPSGWSQVHEFLPTDPEKLKARGHLFAVITAPEAGREVLSRLHEEYFGEVAVKPFNALKLAVEKVSKEFESEGGGVEIAAISFVEGVVYSACGGGSRVMIDRDGSLATILESKEREVSSASGFPKAGDMIIAGSKSFFAKIPFEKIKTALSSGSPDTSIETLAPLVHEDPNSGGIGAVVVKFAEEEVKEERKIFIRPQLDFGTSPRAKKTTLLVGILLLAILAISIGFGVKQKSSKEKQARETERQLEAEAQEAAGYFKAEPELFLDLTLLSSGFKGDKLSFSNNNLFVLDKGSKKIVGIELPSKKSKVVVGQGKLNEVTDIASYEDRVFILAPDGVKEVEDEVKSVVEKDWEGEALIHAFAANLYVLDKSAGAIFRFSGSDEGFGSRQNWLAAGTKPDFNSATAWTFDGAIYVLTSGRVLKFSQGSPQNFSLPSEVQRADAIFAGDENEFVYILDKSGGKVVVTQKNGQFKAQYASDKISEAVGLIASEAERKIILLTGEKLLSIEMKHL